MLLEDIKSALRIDGEALDGEVQDLIDAARMDLIIAGVSKEEANNHSPDALIKRAITLYCKAHFGYDDTRVSERFEESYVTLKQHLTLSDEYKEAVE